MEYFLYFAERKLAMVCFGVDFILEIFYIFKFELSLQTCLFLAMIKDGLKINRRITSENQTNRK